MTDERRITNEYALTTYSLVTGIASGIGAVVLANRLKNGKSSPLKSVVIVSLGVAAITLIGSYLIESSDKPPN